MKKKILLFGLVAGIGSLTLSSYHAGPAANGYDCTGAESAGTGSYANPTGCTTGHCHANSASSAVSVSIELDSAGVATTHYKGGMTYTVKVIGSTTGSNTKYGFQLNSLIGTTSTSSNMDAGTWATTGLPSGTHVTPPGSYTQLTCVEQSMALASSTLPQSFSWTAPAAGTGTISFWAAVNFVNGNGSADAGDIWNTVSSIISEWPASTGVAEVAGADLKVFPNPTVDVLNIAMTAGNCTVNVFDLNGKVVASTNSTTNGHTLAINTASWTPGVYQVVVANGADRKVVSVVKN
jgi:Secretion system C-terminal sorting domain/Reeler domain